MWLEIKHLQCGKVICLFLTLHPFSFPIRRLQSTDIKSQDLRGISSVQLLSHVRPFESPWTAWRQASLSNTNSQSSLKLKNFEHYFTSVWDECSCVVVWAFFGIAFLWDWNENCPFPVLWPLLTFPNLLAYWMQHFHRIIFQDLKQINWDSITSTNFVHSDAF